MSDGAPGPEGWWLFQRLSTGEREDRLELERRETLRAQRAWLGYWFVEESIDRGGEEALDVVLRLLDGSHRSRNMAPWDLAPWRIWSTPTVTTSPARSRS